MARELAFAFGNETPQAQHQGLIIFMAPIFLCRLSGKDGFQFLGQLPISWVLCPLCGTEEIGCMLGGWGQHTLPAVGVLCNKAQRWNLSERLQGRAVRVRNPSLDKNNNDVSITIIECHHVPDSLGALCALSHLILTALLCG